MGFSPASADVPRQDIPTVDPVLLAQSQRSDSIDYLVYFEEKADLSAAYSMDWEERGWYVYETLTAVAERSQARVRRYLDNTGATYEAFWAANVILVESSNSATLNGLQTYTEIETLQAIPQVSLVEPQTLSAETDSASVLSVTSNLTRINADDVWALGYEGGGMVVGSIDTGVLYTHEALVEQYRGNQGGGNFNHNFSWWDAVGGINNAYDDHSHGTHVTGIMVGDDGGFNQIGVAPGADWIACKAFPGDGSTADGNDILDCGQFMLAPTDLAGNNANSDMRPHVVNNSWGDKSQTYSGWFQDTIDAWLAAGIYPIFANGNSGPGLETVGNPARYGNVTGVGATSTNSGDPASFSSWGPTDRADTINPNGYPDMKPQVVAPGVGIRSAIASNNSSYQSWDGTSMAAPHVAGLVALMWQAAPSLLGNYARTETLLEQTAVQITYDDGSSDTPGYPNYATGWGEIDALAAVNKALELDYKRLTGHVYDNQNPPQPIKNAKVTVYAQSANYERFELTDELGYYDIPVLIGESYTLKVSKIWYEPKEKTDITVTTISDESIKNDFNLTEIPHQDYFLPLIIR